MSSSLSRSRAPISHSRPTSTGTQRVPHVPRSKRNRGPSRQECGQEFALDLGVNRYEWICACSSVDRASASGARRPEHSATRAGPRAKRPGFYALSSPSNSRASAAASQSWYRSDAQPRETTSRSREQRSRRDCELARWRRPESQARPSRRTAVFVESRSSGPIATRVLRSTQRGVDAVVPAGHDQRMTTSRRLGSRLPH